MSLPSRLADLTPGGDLRVGCRSLGGGVPEARSPHYFHMQDRVSYLSLQVQGPGSAGL